MSIENLSSFAREAEIKSRETAKAGLRENAKSRKAEEKSLKAGDEDGCAFSIFHIRYRIR